MFRLGSYLLIGFQLAELVAFVAAPAHAGVISFSTPSQGPLRGLTYIEGIWKYAALSGQLFRDADGSGDSDDMEAMGLGGVLQIFRNDVAGGLFTFAASDVRFEDNRATPVTFTGLRGGVVVGTDIFTTTSDTSWSTKSAINLRGVPIDELRVMLPASASTTADVDTIVVDSIPEPSTTTLALLGIGLGGLALRRASHR
jgi:hypothetical protein